EASAAAALGLEDFSRQNAREFGGRLRGRGTGNDGGQAKPGRQDHGFRSILLAILKLLLVIFCYIKMVKSSTKSK
ncbi:hypothetical protein, partial [Chromobacterium phragmitis]|uniref:hypothetical protein n=1 Tax=Chromobacterium phragmitis TaxID=2202141 RepID=UPI0032671237